MDYCQITTKVFISGECGNFLRWPGHMIGSALAISSCKKQTTGLLYICRPTWASGSLWWPPLLGQEAQWDVQWMILPESQGGALNCPSWLALGSAGLLGKKTLMFKQVQDELHECATCGVRQGQMLRTQCLFSCFDVGRLEIAF